eukprot:1812354-Pyramimonas_sp.AAC.1
MNEIARIVRFAKDGGGERYRPGWDGTCPYLGRAMGPNRTYIGIREGGRLTPEVEAYPNYS